MFSAEKETQGTPLALTGNGVREAVKIDSVHVLALLAWWQQRLGITWIMDAALREALAVCPFPYALHAEVMQNPPHLLPSEKQDAQTTAKHSLVYHDKGQNSLPNPNANVSLLRMNSLPLEDSLEKLFADICAFQGCALKALSKHTVFADGNERAPLMLIGEAPGAEEDAKGKPFVGASGKLLDKILASIGLRRSEDVYITNVVFWRPPGNRPPTPEEIALCWPFVMRHIRLINPKVIVTMGTTATKAFLKYDKKSLLQLRTTWHSFTPTQGIEIPLRVTYHPSFLLRSPGYKSFAWEDWQEVKKMVNAQVSS